MQANSSSSSNRINIIDLFHRRLFDKVDFSFVLKYLQENRLAACDNVYTLDSLSKVYIPEMTYDALYNRDCRDLMPLYAAVLKLCVRRRRQLLVHIDLASGKVHHLKKIEIFLEYIGIFPGVTIQDIWLPVDQALPSMSIANVAKRAHDIEEIQALQDRHNVVKQQSQKLTAKTPLPSLVQPKKKEQGTTSIFSTKEINPVEIFLATYNTTVDISKLEDIYTCDALLSYMFKMQNLADPNTDINHFISVVHRQFATYGIVDFDDALQKSSGPYLHNFRKLYNLKEGSGESNTSIAIAITLMWQEFTKASAAGIQSGDFRKMLQIAKESYELQKLQQAAQESEAGYIVENAVGQQEFKDDVNPQPEQGIDSFFEKNTTNNLDEHIGQADTDIIATPESLFPSESEGEISRQLKAAAKKVAHPDEDIIL